MLLLRIAKLLQKTRRFTLLEPDNSTPGPVSPNVGTRFQQLEVGDGPPDVPPPAPDRWVARPAHVDTRPDGSSLGSSSTETDFSTPTTRAEALRARPPGDHVRNAHVTARRLGKPEAIVWDLQRGHPTWGTTPDLNHPSVTHVVHPDGRVEFRAMDRPAGPGWPGRR